MNPFTFTFHLFLRIALATKCDAKFKEENRLTSPGFPNRYEPNHLCVYEVSFG